MSGNARILVPAPAIGRLPTCPEHAEVDLEAQVESLVPIAGTRLFVVTNQGILVLTFDEHLEAHRA